QGGVRVLHRPTGLVATCSGERSQHRNRAQALRMLRGQLAVRALSGGRGDVSGNPVRSYVLGPRPEAIDLRTGHRTGEVRAVLAGGLDDFLEASLRHERGRPG
ncbi:MAG: peptide chain release factor 2, partial [Myxococcales bacterium]